MYKNAMYVFVTTILFFTCERVGWMIVAPSLDCHHKLQTLEIVRISKGIV